MGRNSVYGKLKAFSSWVLAEAYCTERAAFSKLSDPVPMALLNKSGRSMKSYNIIGCHEIIKVKTLDDGTLLVRCRFAPHGNEDSEKENLRTDSASCSPLAFRIFLSVCSLKKMFISKVDFKSAFLQTGLAERDVYVRPTKCDKSKFTLWRLNVAAYGLVNSNPKWQNQSDALLSDCGLRQLAYIPQLFFMDTDGMLELIVIKLVDDILIGGNTSSRSSLTERLKKRFEVGTVSHTPGSLMFFGATVSQSEDGDIVLTADEKLSEIKPATIGSVRRKDQESALTRMESKAFRSTTGMLCFVGMLISPLASFMSIHLQKTSHSAAVKDLSHQNRAVKNVKEFGAQISFPHPKSKEDLVLRVASFTDAARPNDRGQIGVFSGLCIGPLNGYAIFHTVSWTSRKICRCGRNHGGRKRCR